MALLVLALLLALSVDGTRAAILLDAQLLLLLAALLVPGLVAVWAELG